MDESVARLLIIISNPDCLKYSVLSGSEFAMNNKTILILLSIVLLIGIPLIWLTSSKEPSGATADDATAAVSHLVGSEETLLGLTPTLRVLSQSVLNLQLPDEKAKAIFSDKAKLEGKLTLAPEALDAKDGQFAVVDRPQIDTPRDQLKDQKLWQSLFERVDYFENAKFYFVRGELDQDDSNQFNSLVGFAGHAVYRNGRHASLKGQINVTWQRDNSDWKIVTWKLSDFSALENAAKLFEPVFEKALANDRLFRLATKSYHSEITSKLIKGGEFFLPQGITYPFFFPDVTLEHPGVSVVDLNDDGFDDLYFAMQHGPNLFFENNGDGTFREQGVKHGLNVPGDSTSAIFADFDNDGDADLFLGRARQPALYLVNDNGIFREAAKSKLDVALPAMTSSISTVDYNGDGLLDVYLCTYSPVEPWDVRTQDAPLWVDNFLSKSQAKEFGDRNKSSHRFLSRTGPPNILLKNLGDGKFALDENSKQLELWRMSFQASWNDYDKDGDPDLYIANDYAPDTFLRNDSPNGFTDVTADLGFQEMGFGMGVSWGDYDNDGMSDVYVSNMFSKAGQRITSQIEGIDSRLKEIAEGNFLYHHRDQKFDMVSGSSDSQLKVAKAGWSWGGQFFDFDNDGFQDIYVVNGYYTAPEDVAIDIDL